MIRGLLTAIILTAALAPAASAQTLGASWARTFFGCDEDRSCHRIKFSFAPDPTSEYPYQTGTIEAWSWFFTPGAVYNFNVRPFNYFMADITNTYMFSYFDHWSSGGWTAEGLDWRVEGVSVHTSYGPLGLEIGNGEEFWTSVQLGRVSTVPEPASLLLLATGLGGIAAGARRRRRQTSLPNTSA
jgi:hypothetical protein